MNNEHYTLKILNVWITPDPNEAISVDFDQLITMEAATYSTIFGAQDRQTGTLNQYYNRETQLDTISLRDAYTVMHEAKADAVYFIIPDIRVFLANQHRFVIFMKHMNEDQFENSFIITYHNRFSMKQLWVLLDNYNDVLCHSVKGLLQLRNGNASDQALLSHYLHHVINLSEAMIDDMRENEEDFEYYGYSHVTDYLYIYELIALKERLLHAI